MNYDSTLTDDPYSDSDGIVDSDGDGVGDNADPFPYESLEILALDSSDFQPKENVGWIEVSVATLSNGHEMPGIWHPIADDLAIWFAFDGSWSYENNYFWSRQNQTSTGPTGNVGQWSHYSTENPNLYTCRFDWSHGTSGYGFTYDGRIDLDNDGTQDRIQISSGSKFPAEGSQIDFDVILNSLSANLGLFVLPPNFTEDDYDGDGVDDDLDAFPNDPTETSDSDGDGVGDISDLYNGYQDSIISDFLSNSDYLKVSEIQDLRPGTIMIEVSGNQATVQLQMEESTDLESWTETGTPATMTIPADTDTKFFRFKMAE